MKRRTPPAARAAFTLVELLVAMALIIFIMYILAEAFAAGTTAFRNLKAIGDMNERLRSATTTLRRYLQADHFDGRRRLSDPSFWNTGQYQNNGQPVFGPPREGFLRIIQSGASVSEGNDLDVLPSFQSTTQALHLTVKLRGNNRGDYFRASVPNSSNPANVSPLLFLPFRDSRFQDAPAVPPNTPNGTDSICSPVAEVAIFLQDTGLKTEDIDTPGTQPQSLFTMFFRQRLLVPDNSLITPAVSYNIPANPPNWQNYLEVSATQDPNPANSTNMYFNNLQDVTMPARRWGLPGAMPVGATNPATGPNNPTNSYLSLAQENAALAGNDVFLSDVLSCQVSVLLDSGPYLQYQTSFVGNQPIGDMPSPIPVMTNPPPANNTPSVDFIDFGSDILSPYMAKAVPVSGATPRTFDTWSSRKDDVYDYSTSPPPMMTFNHPNNKNHPLNGTVIRIRAIKITLRIWDSKTKQSRMTSVIVDM